MNLINHIKRLLGAANSAAQFQISPVAKPRTEEEIRQVQAFRRAIAISLMESNAKVG